MTSHLQPREENENLLYARTNLLQLRLLSLLKHLWKLHALINSVGIS